MNFFNNCDRGCSSTENSGCNICELLLIIMLLQNCGGCEIDCCTLMLLLLISNGGIGCNSNKTC